jgi:hypothetical protein
MPRLLHPRIKFIEPQLPSLVDQPPEGKHWIHAGSLFVVNSQQDCWSGMMTRRKLEDIEHAIERAAAVTLVEVRDDEIIVTMPGTSYAVTYCKPANSSQLLARRIAESDDKRTSMSLSEFLTLAWKLANDRARELGWIV